MVVTASGIIISEKKILLIRRTYDTSEFPGCWGCPGGRANPGETPEEIAIREVKEETGLDFKPTIFFARAQHKDRDMHRFLGTWSGKINIQEEESTGWGWFTYAEAIHLNLSFDYRDVIEKLHEEGLI